MSMTTPPRAPCTELADAELGLEEAEAEVEDAAPVPEETLPVALAAPVDVNGTVEVGVADVGYKPI